MDPRLKTLLDDDPTKLIEILQSLPESDLWIELTVEICRARGETRHSASRLGIIRGDRKAPIESLVNDFSIVRRQLEEVLAERRAKPGVRPGKTDEEVRADLDAALSTAVSAYFQKRSVDARRDPVTGLLDRGAFEVYLSEEIGRAQRYGRNFSLVLFDIDHFKAINDMLGHPEGDRVLAQVGEVLTRTLRRSDQVFRHGGDEFAAICPETAEAAMRSALARIEANLGEIRISWGAASFPTEATDSTKLVSLADERLYRCKRSHHETIP